MLILGNDVVDLRNPDANVPDLHGRFADRVFSQTEQSLIDSAELPEQELWLYWACKEAAFKALVAVYPQMLFSWRNFNIRREGEVLTVVHAGHSLAAWHHQLPGEAIHVVALGSMPHEGVPASLPTAKQIKDTYSFIGEVDTQALSADPDLDESTVLRAWALEHLRKALQLGTRQFNIMTTPAGVPYLALAGQRRGALSLSHHGRYLAAAFVDSSAS